jgi:hypothetical protein
MTEADVKMSAYHECLLIANEVAQQYGAMPAHAARVIAARIQSLLEQVAEA